MLVDFPNLYTLTQIFCIYSNVDCAFSVYEKWFSTKYKDYSKFSVLYEWISKKEQKKYTKKSENSWNSMKCISNLSQCSQDYDLIFQMEYSLTFKVENETTLSSNEFI